MYHFQKSVKLLSCAYWRWGRTYSDFTTMKFETTVTMHKLRKHNNMHKLRKQVSTNYEHSTRWNWNWYRSKAELLPFENEHTGNIVDILDRTAMSFIFFWNTLFYRLWSVNMNIWIFPPLSSIACWSEILTSWGVSTKHSYHAPRTTRRSFFYW